MPAPPFPIPPLFSPPAFAPVRPPTDQLQRDLLDQRLRKEVLPFGAHLATRVETLQLAALDYQPAPEVQFKTCVLDFLPRQRVVVQPKEPSFRARGLHNRQAVSVVRIEMLQYRPAWHPPQDPNQRRRMTQ
eukprot:5767289-Pyramimonas_sp.AAC.3